MNILIDNTGFQHFGICLNPKLISDKFSDVEIYEAVEDFLQICIQLIFYENTAISAIVPPPVKATSDEIANYIKEFDETIFDPDAFSKQEENMDAILDTIALDFYNRMPQILEECAKTGIKVNSNKITHLDDNIKKVFGLATDAISTKNNELIKKLAENSREKKNDSSVFDIMTRKIPGMDRVAIDLILDYALYGIKKWTPAMLIRLIEELRFISNQNLSKILERPYSPAITRVRDFSQRKEMFYVDLETVFNSLNEIPFISFRIDMESLKNHLLLSGKGIPQAILDKAVELRAIFKPVRELVKTYEKGRYGRIDYLNRRKILNELVDCISSQYGLKGPKSDVLIQGYYVTANLVQNSQVVSGDGNTLNNGGAAPPAFRMSELSKSVVSLTELVNDVINVKNYDNRSSAADEYFKILQRNLATNVKM
jgi:hypothetical protein